MKIKEGFYLSPCGEHIVDVCMTDETDSFVGYWHEGHLGEYEGDMEINNCILSAFLSGWERLEE